MGNKYQLVGSADPASRIDRVDVGDGVILELNGDPQELSSEQVAKLSGYVQLQPVADEDSAPEQDAPFERAAEKPPVKVAATTTGKEG